MAERYSLQSPDRRRRVGRRSVAGYGDRELDVGPDFPRQWGASRVADYSALNSELSASAIASSEPPRLGASDRSILAPRSEVMDHAGVVVAGALLGTSADVEGVERHGRCVARLETLPVDDHPGEDVEHEDDVAPTGTLGANTYLIRDPRDRAPRTTPGPAAHPIAIRVARCLIWKV